jgi:hypothetical protein
LTNELRAPLQIEYLTDLMMREHSLRLECILLVAAEVSIFWDLLKFSHKESGPSRSIRLYPWIAAAIKAEIAAS